MGEILTQVGGLLTFSHFLISQAIASIYLNDEEKLLRIRRTLRDYFKVNGSDTRRAQGL